MNRHMEKLELTEEVAASRMFSHAKFICGALGMCGFEAYIVGGCVRDLLIGRTPHDCDVCTSATPDQVKYAFRRYSDYASVIPTGEKYGTLTIRDKGNGSEVEVTTFRADGEYKDGRRPTEVGFGVSLEEDLKRRDFTMNALAYDPGIGCIIALSRDDVMDARLGIIRCVGEPDRRFGEDALRMLRAVRFAAQLGFTIADDTIEAIKAHHALIANVSAERVRDEIMKILLSPSPEFLHWAWEWGLLETHFPEYGGMVGCTQLNKWHRFDLEDHTFAVVRNVPPEKVLKWAALLHDVGKPVVKSKDDAGHEHFYGHPGLSAEIAERVCRRLKLDLDSCNKIVLLCKTHDLLSEDVRGGGVTPAQVRRVVARIGVENFRSWSKLRRADILAHSYEDMEGSLKRLSCTIDEYERIVSDMDALTCKDLAIDGNDVCRLLGVSPGPIVGETLRALLEAVLNDPSLNEREKLEELLKNDFGKECMK